MASISKAGCFALLGCAFAAAMPGPAACANQYQVLHNFNVGDGSFPNGNLQMDAGGNLYGTTVEGGDYGKGTVFRLHAGRLFQTIYSFTGGADGENPGTGLLIDRSTGDLYGTTPFTIFRITVAGDLSVLYNLKTHRTGISPAGALIRDEDGNLYGTTGEGGPDWVGSVFELPRAGRFKVLSPLGACGAAPIGRLLRNGTDLFGVGNGSVFKVAADRTCTAMYSFIDGEGPSGGLAQDDAGNLYGAYSGSGSYVYALTPGGAFSKLHTLTGADGTFPYGDMLLTKAGKLYGVATRGGQGDNGTVFALDLHGNFTVLHSFTGAPSDGAEPMGGLLAGKDGTFYGTTTRGGANDKGVLFSVTKK